MTWRRWSLGSLLHVSFLLQALMHDPVVAADGHTYERHAMEQWLQRHTVSPVTGTELRHLRLFPNVAIKGLLQM